MFLPWDYSETSPSVYGQIETCHLCLAAVAAPGLPASKCQHAALLVVIVFVLPEVNFDPYDLLNCPAHPRRTLGTTGHGNIRTPNIQSRRFLNRYISTAFQMRICRSLGHATGACVLIRGSIPQLYLPEQSHSNWPDWDKTEQPAGPPDYDFPFNNVDLERLRFGIASLVPVQTVPLTFVCGRSCRQEADIISKKVISFGTLGRFNGTGWKGGLRRVWTMRPQSVPVTSG
ncbi:hypothetical protein C8R47DRAFT_1070323 [Mycena vitilis]|nr:hypothetical protein C8R47DRAFT_1070323 [Mycena vitilis]